MPEPKAFPSGTLFGRPVSGPATFPPFLRGVVLIREPPFRRGLDFERARLCPVRSGDQLVMRALGALVAVRAVPDRLQRPHKRFTSIGNPISAGIAARSLV